jgi:hypothetical protein
MSDETQVAEAEAPQEGLVNFQQEQEAPTQEAPIPVHEPQEDASFNDVDDDEPLERPDYYPQKFWDEDGPDVEKLAKSYAELEKAFKAGKHKAPEDGYNMEDLVDRGLDLEDPTVQAYQDWAQKYGISQQAFEELAGNILEMTGDQEQAMQYDQQQEMQKLGARAQEKITYLENHIKKAPLNQAEREALAIGLNNADSINAMVKFIQGYTNEGIPTEPVVATPEMNVQDLRQAIADPRWQSDPVWRTKIEQQWAAANS